MLHYVAYSSLLYLYRNVFSIGSTSVIFSYCYTHTNLKKNLGKMESNIRTQNKESLKRAERRSKSIAN